MQPLCFCSKFHPENRKNLSPRKLCPAGIEQSCFAKHVLFHPAGVAVKAGIICSINITPLTRCFFEYIKWVYVYFYASWFQQKADTYYANFCETFILNIQYYHNKLFLKRFQYDIEIKQTSQRSYIDRKNIAPQKRTSQRCNNSCFLDGTPIF